MRATPINPAAKTRIMTTIPMSWMRGAGMNSKIASVSELRGPCAVYMKSAKKAASASAKAVPRAGQRYISRASPVTS